MCLIIIVFILSSSVLIVLCVIRFHRRMLAWNLIQMSMSKMLFCRFMTSFTQMHVRFQLSEKEKRRSLLWYGFDRFSRKLRGELSPSCIVSPSHKAVHRTTSSGESRRTLSENDSTSVRTVGSAGTKRRQLFSSNKQISMPAEVSVCAASERVCVSQTPLYCARPKLAWLILKSLLIVLS